MCSMDLLTDISEKIAKSAKEVLGENFDSAVLYGSYARGDFDDESDIDIMILANLPNTELVNYKKPLARLTSELGLKYDIVITVTLKDT
ncbi:MAG: nucleotidyltransferase domain-containing protein, partial [Acutalibacteraceae bacterium]